MSDHAQYLYQALEIDRLARTLSQENHPWGGSLPLEAKAVLKLINHGALPGWLKALQNAPSIHANSHNLSQVAVSIKSSDPISANIQADLLNTLHALKPWRKGPFDLFGTFIDTEWRSDKKWARIESALDLKDKNILDVGCANGYFGWRMLGAGAKSVVGVDPGILFIAQFLLIKQYLQSKQQALNHFLLPYRLEDLPNNLNYFDSVFSMGVLYHRRSVFDHLFELNQCLKSGGDLILETLVIPSSYGEVLVPKDRYARMRNVWFLPNTDILCAWIARAGFEKIRVIDESITSLKEQRKTQWINSQSLEDCLDPLNHDLTIEGYPAPRRATIMAIKP